MLSNGLVIDKFNAFNQFMRYKDSFDAQNRFMLEQLISNEAKNKEELIFYGFCECCNKPSKLILDWKYGGPDSINFRERLICPTCELNNRQRFTFGITKKMMGNLTGKSIYLYEQVTPLYKQMVNRFPKSNIIGSEYLGFDKQPGDIFNGIRHEDGANLSFTDESLDAIISNDVFEHVPNIEKCFEEACRVLKKDGKLIFTVPFYNLEETTTRRARIENGKLIHLKEAQYHGNPIDEKGSLVFYDYGWDIIDYCKKSGFSHCNILMFYGYFYGYLGLNFLFVAEKRSDGNTVLEDIQTKYRKINSA